MNRAFAGLAVFVTLWLAALSTPGSADWMQAQYNGKCSYRCCGENRSCSVASVYMSPNGWPSACNWESICSHQGTIGWSYGSPPSKANSSLSYQRGCWQLWRKGNNIFNAPPYYKTC